MKVSVVIPVYNKEAFISNSVSSVLNQDYEDLEVIIVDDGSTDNSIGVLDAFTDQRIRIFTQTNRGAAAARNLGIAKASGDWVAFLDADDEWLPTKLSEQVTTLNHHPDIVWAACGFETHCLDKKVVLAAQSFQPDWFESKNVLSDALLPLANGKSLSTITIIARREVLLASGGFDINFRLAEDLDLWYRLAIKHPRIVYIPTPLAFCNTEIQGSLTNKSFDPMEFFSINLAEKLLNEAAGADNNRQELLQRFARQLIRVKLENLIAADEKDAGLSLLYNYSALLPRKAKLKALIKLLLPTPLVRTLIRIKARLTHRGLKI